MESQDFIQAAAVGAHDQNTGIAKTLSHFFSSIDHSVTDAYLVEARRGNDILSVRITKTDQMAQVRDILARHNAEHIQYIDTWTHADLSGNRHRGDW